jgi:hypothetical protein
MRRLFTRAGPLVMMAAALALHVPAAAAATETGGGHIIEAQGTMAPGLSTTPANQTVTWDGKVAYSSENTNLGGGILQCHFDANGIAETIVSGAGSGGAACNNGVSVTFGTQVAPTRPPFFATAAVSANCTLSYARTGNEAVVTGSCTISVSGALVAQTGSGTFNGVFHLMPSSANSTSFALTGDFTLT